MISNEEFRFQRHLELWKDQNRNIKRLTALLLLFGILVLFRVLVPFSQSTEKYHAIIQTNRAAKAAIQSQNTVIRQLEEKLNKIRKTISEQPWMAQKEDLVRKFQELNRTRRQDESQQEANKTIRAISAIVRSRIVDPLNEVMAANPRAADQLPALSAKIADLNTYVDEWETNHLNRRWFSTLIEKDREMMELTGALDQRMDKVSASLEKAIQSLNHEVQKGNQEIADLTEEIDRANNELQSVLEQLFPKWMKGIINIQQMTQLFPLALIVFLLYLAWMGGSLSHHYHYVAQRLKIEASDRTDLSMASIWTLTDKGRPGTAMSIIVYGLIILMVWVLFEKGIAILIKWAPTAREGDLFLDPYMMTALGWSGRIVFMVLFAAVLFNRRMPMIRKGGQ